MAHYFDELISLVAVEQVYGSKIAQEKDKKETLRWLRNP